MRILVADDDPIFREMTAGILRERTSHELLLASDGHRALQLALAAPTPFLLILDWVMPGMTGTQLCRLVRAAPLDPQPHVLFITARARREEIVECMAAGADDLLTKPVAPDVLLSRVQLAARRWETFGRGARVVLRALHNAAEEGEGELVVRSGNLCARVLFSQGMIAWAQVIDGTGSLLDALAPEAGIDAETARLIVEECRNTGKSLTETLAAWGLVERSRLRDAMAGWIRRKIASICALPDPRTLFLPQKYKGAVDLLFTVSEVADEVEADPNATPSVSDRPPSSIPPNGWDAAFQQAQTTPEVQAVLERCSRVTGMLGCAVVNRLSGVCFGRLGAELDPDVAWAQLRTLNAVMLREKVEDTLVISSERVHVLTLVPGLGETFAYVVADPQKTTVASARLAVRRAAAGKG